MPTLLRTPEERFNDLPDFPYQPHYVETNGVRMHYLDEGKGEVILCLHGEPSWSFLYRKMIKPLSQHYRVIAPDLIGFGKSDKYAEQGDYTLRMHMDSIKALITQLDLKDITIVVQDWGGLIGLPVVSEMPERFARLFIMNTGLPAGEASFWGLLTHPSRIPQFLAFSAWSNFAKRIPDMQVGRVIKMGMKDKSLATPQVVAAYDAPFPDKSYKAGAKIFPALVPMKKGMAGVAEMKAARKFLSTWQKPAMVVFSDSDPIMKGADHFFRKLIPTAKQHPYVTVSAGHFLQEEKGEELAEYLHGFIQQSPTI